MQTKLKFFIVAVTCGVLLASTAAPAMAAPGGEAAADEVRVQMMVDGQMVDVTDRFVASIDEASARTETDADPSDLLDWSQYYGCFTLNHENDVYAEYGGWWWDGKLQDVRLKCGTSGWGYKHIRTNHEGDWQYQLNTARARGWNTGVGAYGSWDDLMNGAAGTIVSWPDYVGGSAVNNTTCGTGELYFVNSRTGAFVYSFKAIAVWANNSDRLISAYPTSRSTC